MILRDGHGAEQREGRRESATETEPTTQRPISGSSLWHCTVLRTAHTARKRSAAHFIQKQRCKAESEQPISFTLSLCVCTCTRRLAKMPVNVDDLLEQRASDIAALLGSATVKAHRGAPLSDADDALVLDSLFVLRYLLSFKTVAKAEQKLGKALAWRYEPGHRELFSRPLVRSLLTGDLAGLPPAVWRSRQCQCGTVSIKLSRDGAPVTLVRISLSDIEVGGVGESGGLGILIADVSRIQYPTPDASSLAPHLRHAGNVRSHHRRGAPRGPPPLPRAPVPVL